MFKIKDDNINSTKSSVDKAPQEVVVSDSGEALFVVADEASGERLDRFIADSGIGISRNYATILLEKGNVLVNGEPGAAKKYKVKAGDEIIVMIPEPEDVDIKAENIPLDIVYEDEDLIVVNKPRGMVVHPAPGNPDGTLVNAIMFHCGDSLSSINGSRRPGIVHRIDKDTSGLLVIAKNDKAHESLAAQLKEHSMTREYWALCYDNIKDDELTISIPIGRDYNNRLRRAVNGSNPKPAVTHIKVLERFGRYTLVSARLETGRTHQIRVHLAFTRHPLVGDPLYGPSQDRLLTNSYIERYGRGQILHAKTLGFIHPSTGEYMEFVSELPEYFTEALKNAK